jgi:hypothetical protein
MRYLAIVSLVGILFWADVTLASAQGGYNCLIFDCTPTPSNTPTDTLTPSNTPTPTFTRTPTDTWTPGGPTATNTPFPSDTPGPTWTPSDTPTNTPAMAATFILPSGHAAEVFFTATAGDVALAVLLSMLVVLTGIVLLLQVYGLGRR